MHDNILSWMSSPFVLFLLIAIAGGVGYLFATGQMGNVVNMVQTLLVPVRMLLESKGLLAKPAQPTSAKPQQPAAN